MGFIDSYGNELIHCRCEGRNQQQFGKKALYNKHCIVGGILCLLLNYLGLALSPLTLLMSVMAWSVRRCLMM
jgi:hypothetical protein